MHARIRDLFRVLEMKEIISEIIVFKPIFIFRTGIYMYFEIRWKINLARVNTVNGVRVEGEKYGGGGWMRERKRER